MLMSIRRIATISLIDDGRLPSSQTAYRPLVARKGRSRVGIGWKVDEIMPRPFALRLKNNVGKGSSLPSKERLAANRLRFNYFERLIDEIQDNTDLHKIADQKSPCK